MRGPEAVTSGPRKHGPHAWLAPAASKEVHVTSERKERRGFASMSPERQKEIASKGGRAAHEKGTAHEWTPEEARRAGRKGGQVSRGGRGRLVENQEAEPNTPPNDNLGMA